ncbi:MAG: Uma2 family endonuclease [Saprospiraceae bacterium]|nr:Uma2 family endonuclease [Saprospiraceae bacterium]
MSNPPIIERATHAPILLPETGFSDVQFYEFCNLNKDLRIERQANGQIIVMSPTSSITGNRNFNLALELGFWNRQIQLGLVFDSSSGFTLPNGAVRSPDVAWIKKDRWEMLPQSEKERFAAICPDFIIELRSESDTLSELQQKMEEYIDSGCLLAWLVDPQTRTTTVFESGSAPVVVPFEEKLSGGKALPGFELVVAAVIDC